MHPQWSRFICLDLSRFIGQNLEREKATYLLIQRPRGNPVVGLGSSEDVLITTDDRFFIFFEKDDDRLIGTRNGLKGLFFSSCTRIREALGDTSIRYGVENFSLPKMHQYDRFIKLQ